MKAEKSKIEAKTVNYMLDLFLAPPNLPKNAALRTYGFLVLPIATGANSRWPHPG